MKCCSRVLLGRKGRFNMFRRHPDAAVNAARAEVQALLARLGHDITTLDDGGDVANRQAIADASERLNTAGAQLAQAHTVEEISVARSVAIDGLHSTRLVRTKLGLDPGPEPAEVPSIADQQTHAATLGALAERHPTGLGGLLGAGAAGGLLGLLGGALLGDALSDGDGNGGGWGGDGGWGDNF
jgi:hypothetical protein